MGWVSNPLHSAVYFFVWVPILVDSSLVPEFCVGLNALLREIMGYGIVFVLLIYIYLSPFSLSVYCWLL